MVVAMAEPLAAEQRAHPRVSVALDVHLGRRRGNEVVARTCDLCEAGAMVVSDRPLRIDEELAFDLQLGAGGRHLTGTARVLRQHSTDMYALRFEQVAEAGRGELGAFVRESLHI
jgi:hypothetical protein